MDITTKTNTNTNEFVNEKSEELIKVTPIEETPFGILKAVDKYCLVLGKYRLTENLGSEEAVREEATNTSWERIMQIAAIMVSESDEITSIKKELETIKEKLNL